MSYPNDKPYVRLSTNCPDCGCPEKKHFTLLGQKIHPVVGEWVERDGEPTWKCTKPCDDD